MGACGGKPKVQKRNIGQKIHRNSTKGLSFLQQVLTVNGVKSDNYQNVDPRKIIQQIQQTQNDTDEFADKKITLAQINESSILKRRQKKFPIQGEQQFSSPIYLEGNLIDNYTQMIKQNTKNKQVCQPHKLQPLYEVSVNTFQNYSTTNSFQPTFSQAQINIPNQRQSANSLDNIK
ncbi:hypothetical protein TTHERM_00149180 (macronuclear) [Tetrahymena thermophila SB210]|uniref:Uncharacterized protein n=1 Tax=Tetrahymena thermophila (strain SB210) TaxID=312017 RepID=I7LWB3_TETTS|nr:hypothetical protein TTHERM_00149180 [Tetrahymena thermophila SB210]EAS01308.1 hypothetical protein TTHERM_00149180 [Tetrahymena thermophila SB210]|eukprot:XP_001021553.1 hypothetical protein TTHERM_00149180 [Tetrahymena thermophila SB210]